MVGTNRFGAAFFGGNGFDPAVVELPANVGGGGFLLINTAGGGPDFES